MVNEPDDIYDDPQTIGDDDDKSVLNEDKWLEEEKDDLSQTPYLPEKDKEDPRGDLAEVDPDDQLAEEESDPDHPEDADYDANKLNNTDPLDEHDGTEE